MINSFAVNSGSLSQLILLSGAKSALVNLTFFGVSICGKFLKRTEREPSPARSIDELQQTPDLSHARCPGGKTVSRGQLALGRLNFLNSALCISNFAI
jgi:hypothetical protein